MRLRFPFLTLMTMMVNSHLTVSVVSNLLAAAIIDHRNGMPARWILGRVFEEVTRDVIGYQGRLYMRMWRIERAYYPRIAGLGPDFNHASQFIWTGTCPSCATSRIDVIPCTGEWNCQVCTPGGLGMPSMLVAMTGSTAKDIECFTRFIGPEVPNAHDPATWPRDEVSGGQ